MQNALTRVRASLSPRAASVSLQHSVAINNTAVGTNELHLRRANSSAQRRIAIGGWVDGCNALPSRVKSLHAPRYELVDCPMI
jgi:hypothetical protein